MKRAGQGATGPTLPAWMAGYWRPTETGSKQIRHWDEGYRVIGTNYLRIGRRIKKQEAGNAQCSLRPKTEPCSIYPSPWPGSPQRHGNHILLRWDKDH